MRTWGGLGTRVLVLASISVQIYGQLLKPEPKLKIASIYPPNVNNFCRYLLNLSLIVIPIKSSR